MKWEADQSHGFIGWGGDGQPRWKGKVELGEALAAVGDVLELFWGWLQWPDAPPFSGGVLDAWPARLAEGLAVCRAEWRAIQEYRRWESQQKEMKRG